MLAGGAESIWREPELRRSAATRPRLRIEPRELEAALTNDGLKRRKACRSDSLAAKGY